MTAPVKKSVDDVLKGRQISAYHEGYPELLQDLAEARAAVAELLEVAQHVVHWIDQLNAALARCKGEAS